VWDNDTDTVRRREYAPGSVVKVEVKNFMTYANCVIEPGPRLNLVLGPNGAWFCWFEFCSCCRCGEGKRSSEAEKHAIDI